MSSHHHFAQTLEHALRRSRRVLLTVTTGIDGDSLGSMLAMCAVVKAHGKEVWCYAPESIPAMFNYLRGPHRVMLEFPGQLEDYDLVIIFDTGDVKRSPLASGLTKRKAGQMIVINIDHHPTVIDHRGQRAIDINHVDTSASSTTEMLYRVFEAMGVKIDAHTATCLLTGILTDTGHFTNMGSTFDSMSIGAKLMALGADHRTITDATMRNKDVGTLRLWGRALSRLNINNTTGVVSTVLTLEDFRECKVGEEASVGIANFLNTLSEGRVSLVLQQVDAETVKGSFRTTSDINVAEMAKQFGGGGHTKAAGFTMKGRLVHTRQGWTVEPAREAQ